LRANRIEEGIMSDPKNLVQGVMEEIDRCTEVAKRYHELGAPGAFGYAAITGTVERAKAAVGRGDIEELLQVLADLKSVE